MLKEALDFVNSRQDCADFAVTGLLRLYYKHADSGKLRPGQKEAIRRALLGFQYWWDEPNPDLSAMELWTENHQILIFSAEYLAGQLFLEEIFTNNGQSSRQRMESARQRIARWIEKMTATWRFTPTGPAAGRKRAPTPGGI